MEKHCPLSTFGSRLGSEFWEDVMLDTATAVQIVGITGFQKYRRDGELIRNSDFIDWLNQFQ